MISEKTFLFLAIRLTAISQPLFAKFSKLMYALLVTGSAIWLAACSSGGSDSPANNVVKIGNGLGTEFQAGTLAISNTALNDGESTTIEISLVNGNNTAYTTPTEIIFAASCANSSITPSTTQTSGGLASAQYIAGTCEGTDTIVAIATVNGNTLTATGNVTITRPIGISLAIDDNELFYGASTTLTATLAYNDLSVYTTPVEVSFTAACASSSLTPATANTVNGSVSVDYVAGNCTGTDTITATAVIDDSTITASIEVTIVRGVQIAPLSISNASLTTGGSALVTATLTYTDSSVYDVSTSIVFTTSCQTSTINPNPATTSGGVALATYVAGNCSGIDTITAMANIDGIVLTRTVNVSIAVPVVNLLFGSGAGVTFVQSQLESGTGNTAAGQSALAAGGSTSILGTIVDADNSNLLYTMESHDVVFSSPCIASGNAVITSPVTTASGVAMTTYVSNGCVGDDTVTGTVDLGGTLRQASVTITNLPASVGAIQFVSASPDLVTMAGLTGTSPGFSVVTFRVVNSSGDPIQGQLVNFSLSTNLGGIDLSAISGVTTTDGTVTVLLQPGTISTTARVTAATTDISSGITYSVQSDPIVISTGIADENSVSLSISDCNPAGAFNNDGVTVNVTVQAADYFNYPVPDGTAVSFTTEGGSIESSCLTINGACSVTWLSQEPRPMEAGQIGRVTILAYIIGNESFFDSNDNGVYDDNDPLFTASHPDLPEAWLDSDEDGVRDAATEEFVDFNLSGTYNGQDGLYSGVLCQRTSDCADSSTLHVARMGVIHMANNNNDITINGGAGDNTDFNLPLSNDTPLSVTITVNSLTGHYPATGTTITVETTNGNIVGNSSFVVPTNCDTLPGDGYETTFNIVGDGSGNTGTLTVTTTSGGIVSQQTVNVTDQTE
jgi:hypothetical protein